MNFEEFTHEFGAYSKQSRIHRGMSLQSLAIQASIVSDQIQKIESAKHGGVQLRTYAKLLSGLKVGLSFTKESTKKNDKLIPISSGFIEFINEMFFGLPTYPDLQFLNMKPTLLIKQIGRLVSKKKERFELVAKGACKKCRYL
jgi:transcriptional regulator with XRE-family HTH domain